MKKKSEYAEMKKKENHTGESTGMSDANKDKSTEKMSNTETVKEEKEEKQTDMDAENGQRNSADAENKQKDSMDAENGQRESADAENGQRNSADAKTDQGDSVDVGDGPVISADADADGDAAEDDEGEKLLFRDTTPELVAAAVHSLNQQGLSSVQYREEEDSYALYASPEEFERARELLIEILKDEADSIRERARTLEAKKKLREMETTELAPGYRPEKTPKEKYEDANSTAIAFLLVGALGLVFVVLEYFGIFFSLGLTENVKYIFYPTMLVMFGVFLIVGFMSLNSAAKWKVKMYEEAGIMNNVREYVEHDLIHEIRALMAERVVREAEIEDNAATAVEQPNPEDALMQLTNLIEGGFPGEEELEEAERAVMSVRTDSLGQEEMPVQTDISEQEEIPAQNDILEQEEMPAQTDISEQEETSAQPDFSKQDEKSNLADISEQDEISEHAEMENVFNDYYAMEHEIQLRLIKEFPDLPANLLVEATEYVIKLVEENLEKDEDTEYAEDQDDMAGTEGVENRDDMTGIEETEEPYDMADTESAGA